MAGVLRNERGMTIIEMTVMLSVMFILAGVMSPIVSNSMNTARVIKAQKDASIIASGILTMQSDVGATAFRTSPRAAAARGIQARDVEVLASRGDVPAVEEAESSGNDLVLAGAPAGLLRAPGAGESTRTVRQRWINAARDALEDHLISNRRGYRSRQPGETDGWHGPYVSTDIGADPWGNQYMVNTHWLGRGQGESRRAVFVLSAGANGTVETPFEQSITDTRAWGDDIVIRIQ